MRWVLSTPLNATTKHMSNMGYTIYKSEPGRVFLRFFSHNTTLYRYRSRVLTNLLMIISIMHPLDRHDPPVKKRIRLRLTSTTPTFPLLLFHRKRNSRPYPISKCTPKPFCPVHDISFNPIHFRLPTWNDEMPGGLVAHRGTWFISLYPPSRLARHRVCADIVASCCRTAKDSLILGENGRDLSC